MNSRREAGHQFIPIVFIFFGLLLTSVQVVGQDPLPLDPSTRALDDIRSAFHRSDYRAVLSMIRAFPDSGRPEHQEENLFMEACSAARLHLTDGGRKLEDFLSAHPYSSRTDLIRFELMEWHYRGKAYDKVIRQSQGFDMSLLPREQRHKGLFYRGYSFFAQRKLRESLADFNAIKLTDGPFAQAATYYAGFSEYTLGENEAALSDLKRLENQEGYSTVVPVLIANVLARLGRTDELMSFAKSVETKSGVQGLADIRLLVAEAYFARKKYSESLPGYTEYLKSGPVADVSLTGVLYRAGFAAYSAGKFKEATDWLNRVASAKDSLGRHASYYMGVSLMRTGQKPLALSAFQAAAAAPVGSTIKAEADYQAAKLLYDLGRSDQAIDGMEAFLQRHPSDSHTGEVRELLSGAYVNANNYRKAISHIEALNTRTPATDRAYQKACLFLGYELFNKGDFSGANSSFRKSMAYPLDQALLADAATWNGEALSQLGQLADAAESYEKVIGNTGAGIDAILRSRYGLGYIRFNQRQYDRALTSFRDFIKRALANDPRLADVFARLADCQYVSKAYADALQSYRKSLESGNSTADYARMQAGVVLGILRRHDEGIDELSRVIREFPSSVYRAEALFHKAQLEFETSRYAEAGADYSHLLDTEADSRFVPFALVRRAAARFNLKDYSGTADDYLTALRDFPEHPVCADVLLPLQEALGLAGRSGEFDAVLREFKQRNPTATGLENIEFDGAKSLYFSQKYKEAIQALGSYIAAYPNQARTPEARYYRAEAFYRLKEFPAALRSYYELENELQFPNASRVAARIAELESKAGNYRDAIPAYMRLGRLAQSPKEKSTSRSGLMESWFLLAGYDSAARYAGMLMDDPGSGLVLQNRASLIQGRIFQTTGQPEKAEDLFLTTINNSRDESGAEAKFRLAELQFARKDYKACYETVVSLNSDYAAYTEWVGRGFLLLADSFVATGEIFQATATLESLEKFPLPHVREAALKKLAAIEAGENERRLNPQDSTDHE